jgi:lipocalin
MRSNTTLFVRDTYRKFLVSEPNDSELWYLKKLLAENPDITTDDVYYAFMTSEEYKYY